MSRPPKILFLANWPRTARSLEDYAFFAHWHRRPRLRFLGRFSLGFWTRWERDVLRFYLLQPLAALFLAPFYDAVIAYSSQCGLPLAWLLRCCFWMRTKLIVFDVESFGRAKAGWRLALVRFAARRIDHVVYAASGQAKYYDDYLPFLQHRRTWVPIGIGEYQKTQAFETGTDGPIVALGRHGAAFRDWATLLRAYADHHARAPLWIVGREDLPEVERNGVPVPPNVTFLPLVPLAKLGEIIEGARFVVLPLPEREQSLGQLTVLFAMAMGKAVVASGVVGLADYLTDGETGLLYPPGDAAGLSARLKILLDDPPRAVAMGRAARERQETAFNDRLMGERWEKVLVTTTGRPDSGLS
jgi:glycosyltransferase involved in cell wall biosynthesis